MPIEAVILQPGLDVEQTPTYRSAGYAQMSNLRFRAGLAEKLGGWTPYYPLAVGGEPKDLHAWQDLNFVKHLAVATTTELDVITNGVLQNITPQELLTNPGIDIFTKSLLHFNGADASTTFTDQISTVIWTPAGNAQLDTATFEFATASGLFDGTGDDISTPDDSDWNLGTADFTIDCWFNCNVATGTARAISGQGNLGLTAAGTSFVLRRETDGTMRALVSNGTTLFSTQGAAVFSNTVNTGWHHIALVRASGVITLYIDGTAVDSDVFTGTTPNVTDNLYIGARQVNTDNWLGWIDEYRFSFGIARWTANFTPPTRPYNNYPFDTTNGDETVTITDNEITNVTAFDAVEFLTPVSVGGIILSGIYRIATRTGTSSYTIESREPATATETSAGRVPVYTTTSGSAAVSVALDDHGQSVGNTVILPIAKTVGGIVIQGKYTVTSITSADVFVITHTSAATSSATGTMNNGLVAFRYYIALGSTGAGLGYGLGAYGAGPYGLGGAGGSDQVGNNITASDWTLDNWGELLIASPNNRGIFFWGPSGGFINAQLIVEAPLYNNGVFISQAQQQMIAYGSSINAWETGGIGVYQDPLVVAWCDVSNFFDWTATSENLAGNFRIPTGSELIAGIATKNRNLLWTDLEMWSQMFTGQIDQAYAHNPVGSNCGIIGPHAMACQGDAAYWVGKANFYSYAGSGVQAIPCPVWDKIFQDIDRDNERKTVMGSNSDFTEIWTFYPSVSGGTGYPDKCVKFNTMEGGAWDALPMDRLAWIDRSVLGASIGISAPGIIYSHETGYNDGSAPLTPRFVTGFFYLTESQDFVYIDEIIPDFTWGKSGSAQNAQIFVRLHCVDWPGEEPRLNGPYLTMKSTPRVQLDPPIRCRQVALEVFSNDIDSFWRLGRVRFRYSEAGRSSGTGT